MFTEEEIKQYLLKDLSDEKTEVFEKAFFTDDELFQKLEIAEMLLTDSFVRGEMPTGERKKFSENFAVTPERIAEIEKAKLFYKNLEEYRSEFQTSKKEARRFAATAVYKEKSFFDKMRDLLGGNLLPMLSAATVLLLLTFGFAWVFLKSDEENLAVKSNDANIANLFNRTVKDLPDNPNSSGNNREIKIPVNVDSNRKNDSAKLNKNTNSPKENPKVKLPEKVVSAYLSPGKDGFDVSPASPKQNTPPEIKVSKDTQKIALRLQLNQAKEKEVFTVTILGKTGEKIQTFTNVIPGVFEGKKIVAVEVSSVGLKDGKCLINASGNQGNLTTYQFNKITQ